MNGKQCPKCGQQSIAFLAFILKFNQSNIRCQHCGVHLKGTKLLRLMFYSALVFGLFLGFSIAFLEDIYKWGIPSSLIIFLSVLVIVGIPVEIISWKYGNYLLDEQNIHSTPTTI